MMNTPTKTTRGINIIARLPYDREQIYWDKEKLPQLEEIAKEIVLLLSKKQISIAESKWILTTVETVIDASKTQVDF